MTDRPTNAPRGLEDVLSAHFVMWFAMDDRPGEWRCSCGAKFGFSDSVIAHVAAAIRAREWLTSEAVVGEPEHEVALRSLWRELAKKRIEDGVDWPYVVRTLFEDVDRLRAALAAAAGVV